MRKSQKHLATSYKVFSNILEKWLRPSTKTLISEYQGGFKARRSTTDQLFTVQPVLERCQEYIVIMIFVGFKQTTISTVQNVATIWHSSKSSLTHKNDDGDHDSSKCGFRICLFVTQKELKKGGGLTPKFRNLALKDIVRKLSIDTRRMLLFKSD